MSSFFIDKLVFGDGGVAEIQISDDEYERFAALIKSFKTGSEATSRIPLHKLVKQVLLPDTFSKFQEAVINNKQIKFYTGDTERPSMSLLFG